MGVKFQLELRMTRRQKIATTLWCGAGTALFTVPPAIASWADVSSQTAAAGLGIPAAVAVVFWTVKSAVDQHDASRAGQDRTVALGEAMVRSAERAAAPRPQKPRFVPPPPMVDADGRLMEGGHPVPQRRGQVIEGEVVR